MKNIRIFINAFLGGRGEDPPPKKTRNIILIWSNVHIFDVVIMFQPLSVRLLQVLVSLGNLQKNLKPISLFNLSDCSHSTVSRAIFVLLCYSRLFPLSLYYQVQGLNSQLSCHDIPSWNNTLIHFFFFFNYFYQCIPHKR